MKDNKIPSHQVDVVEIMKKIRQSTASNRADMSIEERTKREAKSEFVTLVQNAQVPDYLVNEIRQQGTFTPYDPQTLYFSARPGVGSVIGWIRRILRPITKLFVNLDPLAHEVNRLTLLNNFYLKTIQDLIGKTAALRVEVHSMRKRVGHHRSHDNQQRHNHHRRHYRDRDRRDRRENNNNNESRSSAPETASVPSTSQEPTA
ncbi:MAG: hypothetical protein C5B54_10305 [Acidobacteria bacterium]|nr:MAG: hypothetical protein C5B54_10305 [Acidobacteriota bacterium]